ncbi:MAG: cupredoxin domain-containing protein [Candidatus Pacearchaeota archaeon]
MKNTTIILFIFALVFLIGGFVFLSEKKVVSAGEIVREEEILNGEMQKVVLSQEGLNYKDVYAEPGKPISITADNSVKGCLRAVVFDINGKKYSKILQTSSDILELPSLSQGTYTFSCSMGMGYGKLIVR